MVLAKAVELTVKKRPFCHRCERPETACFCELLTSVENSIPVALFRHSREEGHALGTAPILVQGLKQCELRKVGNAETVKQETLPAPWLLFPSGDGAGEATDVGTLEAAEVGSLIVLDGTWRKCKRMLLESPWLQSLPRISLSQLPASRNKFRKSSQPDGVSTLEAVVHTLETLEKKPGKYAHLLNTFDTVIEQYQSHIPAPNSCP